MGVMGWQGLVVVEGDGLKGAGCAAEDGVRFQGNACEDDLAS